MRDIEYLARDTYLYLNAKELKNAKNNVKKNFVFTS